MRGIDKYLNRLESFSITLHFEQKYTYTEVWFFTKSYAKTLRASGVLRWAPGPHSWRSTRNFWPSPTVSFALHLSPPPALFKSKILMPPVKILWNNIWLKCHRRILLYISIGFLWGFLQGTEASEARRTSKSSHEMQDIGNPTSFPICVRSLTGFIVHVLSSPFITKSAIFTSNWKPS